MKSEANREVSESLEEWSKGLDTIGVAEIAEEQTSTQLQVGIAICKLLEELIWETGEVAYKLGVLTTTLEEK